MEPGISIITVSYNSALTIEQAMVSVFAQTYPRIEYIIIDGGSTDGTVDIIHRYEKKLAYWVSEPDHGIYEAMNKGVRAATGDYILFLGSDDALAGKQAIEQVIPCLERRPDILSCWVYLVYGKLGRQRPYTNLEAQDPATYDGGMVPHQGMFTQRALFQKYSFDETYKIAGDYKFFLQCYFDPHVTIQYSNAVVAFFATEETGASMNQVLSWEEMKRVHQELHVPFGDDARYRRLHPRCKELIKTVTNRLGITGFLRDWYRKRSLPRHHCDNPICRWCRRA